jgi:thioredoxin reductase (NADPH)
VENLVLKNVKTNEVSNLPVAGVFMFVGQAPYDECVRGLVKATKEGWITVNEGMETSVEGIFAAGDVCHKHLRQVVTAASDGAIAAMSASAYINEQIHLRSAIMAPESATAFFYMSIDAGQARLSNEMEKAAREKGKKIAIIDSYKNNRMTEKLGLSSQLPAVVELQKGNVTKITRINSDSDVAKIFG